MDFLPPMKNPQVLILAKCTYCGRIFCLSVPFIRTKEVELTFSCNDCEQ